MTKQFDVTAKNNNNYRKVYPLIYPYINVLLFVSIIVQQDATIYSLFISATSLQVTGGISTHHQELISLYLQYLALIETVTATCETVTATCSSRQVAVEVSLMPDTVDTVL